MNTCFVSRLCLLSALLLLIVNGVSANLGETEHMHMVTFLKSGDKAPNKKSVFHVEGIPNRNPTVAMSERHIKAQIKMIRDTVINKDNKKDEDSSAIHQSESQDTKHNSDIKTYEVATPLVLDLDGDGIDYIALNDSTATYDLDGDGEREQTAWVGSDDALLAYDANADGLISGREELALSDYVEGAETDLEGLKHFDTNNDGRFDASDEQWQNFKVFQDKNSDGISSLDELTSLNAAGIVSLSLTSDNNRQTLADGSVTEYGQFAVNHTDGTVSQGSDVAFAYCGTGNVVKTASRTVFGIGGDDTLWAASATNIMVGGGEGDDTFVQNSGSGGDTYGFQRGVHSSVTIVNFNISRDKLDFHDILVDDENNDLTQYLSFDLTDPANSVLEVRETPGGDITQRITLQGVDVSILGNTDAEIINSLINNGNLNTDI